MDFTDISKNKKAIGIALSLTGDKREVAFSLPMSDLKADDGVEKLLQKLQEVFDVNSIDKSFADFLSFVNLRRSARMSINDYIIQFDRLNNSLKTHKLLFPDNILAAFLLHGASLEVHERQMILTATASFDIGLMKANLRRILSDKNVHRALDDVPVVKEEGAFASSEKQEEVPESALFASKNRKFGDTKKRSFPKPQYKGKNPVDKRGNVSTCAICGSRNHWARLCPDKESTDEKVRRKDDNQDGDDDRGSAFIIFACMTSKLLEECWNRAILDTGCSKTVCGQAWLKEYTKHLSAEDKKVFSSRPTTTTIVFGGDNEVRATKTCVLPVQFGQEKCALNVEVIPGKLPLLLSVKSMTKAGFIIDLVNSKVKSGLSDVAMPIILSNTGHVKLELLPSSITEVHEEVSLFAAVDLNEKVIRKLHRQFAHCSSKRLLGLLKNAGQSGENVRKTVNTVVESCEVCAKFGKKPSHPVVALPLAENFNEVVSIDLHEVRDAPGKRYYIHVIDLFSRFSQGEFISDKHAETIVNSLNKLWCFNFGTPDKILTDNGREFDNDIFRQNSEFLDIELLTTPAESPWSNGVVERHNLILTEAFEKSRLSGASPDVSLQHAIYAKNCLSNHSGFSAYQLVFGRLPRVPNVTEHKLPALGESIYVTDVVENHLRALRLAREGFIAAESSERIKRALRFNIRENGQNIEIGDAVFYQRQNSNWRGPAKVVGADRPNLLVKHGGTVYRVHQTQLRKAVEQSTLHIQDDCDLGGAQTKPLRSGSQTIGSAIADSVVDEGVSDVSPSITVECDTLPRVSDTLEVRSDEPKDPEASTGTVANAGRELPRVKSKVRIIDDVFETPVDALVLSRAGKATGKNKSWFNVELVEPMELCGNQRSIDFAAVRHWEPINEHCGVVLACTEGSESFDEAKREEVDAWKHYDVYEEVDSTEGITPIDSKWVLSIKPDGRHKARLVARGYQDVEGVNSVKDAPTCMNETFRIVLSHHSSRANWTECTSLDVKTAFLQGIALKRTVFLKPPREFEKGKLWKLKKCIYGLPDAARHWYDRVFIELSALGGVRSNTDYALFIWKDSGCLCVHVDDFWAIGTVQFFSEVVEKLSHVFDIGSKKALPHTYLGVELSLDVQSMVLNQSSYVSRLEELPQNISQSGSMNSQTTPYQKSILRGALGQLLWPAMRTRPDILYEVSFLIGNIGCSTVSDLNRVNKLIRRVKLEDLSLNFPNLGEPGNWRIVVFSDATLNNNSDGGTHGGFLVFLVNEETRKCGLVAWQSKKLRRIARSTLCAEVLACI